MVPSQECSETDTRGALFRNMPGRSEEPDRRPLFPGLCSRRAQIPDIDEVGSRAFL